MSVYRNLFARSYQHYITRHHLVDGQLEGLSVPLNAGGLGLKTHELFDGLARAPFGDSLQILAHQDERDNGRRRLVVHMNRPGRQELREKGSHDRIAVGGAGTEHHERVHVRRTVPQGRPARTVEAQARPELHDRRQDEGEIEDRLHRHYTHELSVQRRNQHRNHHQQD